MVLYVDFHFLCPLRVCTLLSSCQDWHCAGEHNFFGARARPKSCWNDWESSTEWRLGGAAKLPSRSILDELTRPHSWESRGPNKHHVPPLAHQLPIWPVPCCHSSKWCENDKWVTKRLEEQHASGNENCHSKKNLPARVPDKPIILSSIRPSIISISQSEYYMRMCVCVCLLELPILSNIRSQVLCIHWRKRECVAQDGVWSSLFPCSRARAHQVWAIGMEHTIPVQWSRFEDQSPAAPVLS